jgi:hypothetical protein
MSRPGWAGGNVELREVVVSPDRGNVVQGIYFVSIISIERRTSGIWRTSQSDSVQWRIDSAAEQTDGRWRGRTYVLTVDGLTREHALSIASLAYTENRNGDGEIVSAVPVDLVDGVLGTYAVEIREPIREEERI